MPAWYEEISPGAGEVLSEVDAAGAARIFQREELCHTETPQAKDSS